MSEDDVSARDALAIAQRSLARLQEIENELRGELEETNKTVEQLQDDLTSQLAEAHSRIDTTNELVRRVDSELSARERRERRERSAPRPGWRRDCGGQSSGWISPRTTSECRHWWRGDGSLAA